jgi:hypothetical protein
MPLASVDPKELLGRRLFGKAGWDAARPLFDFMHFVDTRLQSNLSIDLLGKGNIEKRRLRPLTELADAEAQARNPTTTFEGWAAVLLQDLRFPGWNSNVRPAPISGRNGVPPNEFHAEISRNGFREKAQSYAFATMMADRFSRKGRYVPPERDSRE